MSRYKIKHKLPRTPYLILHSPHRGDMLKPWQVLRCFHEDDDQELLFTGSRAEAIQFLRDKWDSNNS